MNGIKEKQERNRMRLKLVAFSIYVCMLLLFTPLASADDWPMFHHDLRHTGHSAESISDNLELLWSYETGKLVSSSPVVSNGKVFVSSDDDKIYCLNANNGNLIWSYKTGDNVVSSPAVADGKLFFGSGDNRIYCLGEDTGRLIWSYETGDEVPSSPAVADGKVFIGSWDDRIYCLDENTGDLIWSYETDDWVLSSPTVANGKVFVGSYDDKIYCLDADTGDLIWSYKTGYCVLSSPAVSNGKVFVGSDDDKIYCLNENNGYLIWSYKTGNPVSSSPAVSNGKVFVGSDDDKIYCLNENDGNLIWSYKTGDNVVSSPAVADGKVFVGSEDNKIYCLDEDTGKLIWSYETGGRVRSPALADGKLFVGSFDNKIYCFGTKPSLPSSTSIPTATPTATPTTSAHGEEKFKVRPTIILRPVVGVIEKEQDGIVELYIDNPSLNDVVLHLDAHVMVPAGIHVYSEQNVWTRTADGVAYAPGFEIPPGTEKTISIHIMADENANIGSHTLHFSGIYYPGNNKDLHKPIALTYPIEVKEASDREDILIPTPAETPPTTSEERADNTQVMLYGIIGAVGVLCLVIAVKAGGKVARKAKVRMEKKRMYKHEMAKYNAKLEQWKREGYKVDELEKMLK